MYLLLFLIMLIVSIKSIESQDSSKNNWTLVADPFEEHPWWIKGNQMKGQQVYWEIKELKNFTILKLKLFESSLSYKHTQLSIQISSSQNFNINSFSAEGKVNFSFFEMNKMVKKWQNSSSLFNILILNGDMVLTGSDFYFSIKLQGQIANKVDSIILLIVIILIKNYIILYFRDRTAKHIMIVPGILIYYLIFPKGFLLSLKDIIFVHFQQQNTAYWYFLLVFLICPYCICIYHMFFKALLFRWKDQRKKTTFISLIATLLSSFGIFIEANEISLILIFALEIALQSKPDEKKKCYYVPHFIFLVDLALTIYLWMKPLYPGRHIFLYSSWKYGVFFIFLFQGINILVDKKGAFLTKSTKSAQKTNKKDKKKD